MCLVVNSCKTNTWTDIMEPYIMNGKKFTIYNVHVMMLHSANYKIV